MKKLSGKNEKGEVVRSVRNLCSNLGSVQLIFSLKGGAKAQKFRDI